MIESLDGLGLGESASGSGSQGQDMARRQLSVEWRFRRE